MNQYGYPKSRLIVEHPVRFGRERKRADIVIRDKDRPEIEYLIVEVKSPYSVAARATAILLQTLPAHPSACGPTGMMFPTTTCKDPNYFEEISDIPGHNQTLADILNERFTLRELILKDKVANDRKSLKDIILEMEDEVLANAGVDVFEEVFKLIFTSCTMSSTAGMTRSLSTVT